MEQRAIERAAELLLASRKAVAVTGAGVSTESGIPDFRSRGGLWSRFDPMEYGTLGAFRLDPEKVWQMLGELLGIVSAEPNAGHRAMARLEEHGVLKGIITQNIDGLHQKAGSKNVIEFHGSLDTFSCLTCGAVHPLARVLDLPLPPRCQDCGTILKPDIVFFDEQIPPGVLARTDELLADADVMIVAGTSCQVVPASFLPGIVHSRGGKIIEINLAPALAGMAEVVLQGRFAEEMEALLRASGII
jgi:NAD-dependent deacetylase